MGSNISWNTTSVPNASAGNRPWSWNTTPPPNQGYAQRFSAYTGGNNGNRNAAYTWSPTETKSERLKQGFMKSVERGAQGGSFGGPIGAAIGGGLGLIEGLWGGGPKPISAAEQWTTNVGIEGNEAFKTYAPWLREQGMNALSYYQNALMDQWNKFTGGQGIAAQGGQGADKLEGYLAKIENARPEAAEAALARNLRNQQTVNTSANQLTLAQLMDARKKEEQLRANPMLSAYEKARLASENQRGTSANVAAVGAEQLGQLRGQETSLVGNITNFFSQLYSTVAGGYATLAQVRAQLANLGVQEQRLLLEGLAGMDEKYREMFKSLLPPEMQYMAAMAGGAMNAQNNSKFMDAMTQAVGKGIEIYKNRGGGGGGGSSGGGIYDSGGRYIGE